MIENKALRYNSHKLKWSLLHYKSLEPIIEVLTYGAHKYTIYENEQGEEIKGADIPINEAYKYKIKQSGVNNWQKGLDKREILNSMQRHLALLLDGEELDSESKLHHIGHIGCNFLFYSYELLREKNKQNEEISIV